jgi:hypothetical protein
VKAVTIRHRIDADTKQNTSWCLVELDSLEAVEAALAAVKPPRALIAGARKTQTVDCLCSFLTKHDEKRPFAKTGTNRRKAETKGNLFCIFIAAGTNVLKVTKFDKEVAKNSTGGMVTALAKMTSLMGAAMATQA